MNILILLTFNFHQFGESFSKFLKCLANCKKLIDNKKQHQKKQEKQTLEKEQSKNYANRHMFHLHLYNISIISYIIC